jgi:hypothetical protein
MIAAISINTLDCCGKTYIMRPLRYSINVTLDGFAGLSKRVDLKLVSRLEFGSGAVAMQYEPRR